MNLFFSERTDEEFLVMVNEEMYNWLVLHTAVDLLISLMMVAAALLGHVALRKKATLLQLVGVVGWFVMALASGLVTNMVWGLPVFKSVHMAARVGSIYSIGSLVCLILFAIGYLSVFRSLGLWKNASKVALLLQGMGVLLFIGERVGSILAASMMDLVTFRDVTFFIANYFIMDFITALFLIGYGWMNYSLWASSKPRSKQI